MVNYELSGSVATITMDDGKVNALSPAMQAAIHAALEKADGDGAAVVLAGRPKRFSAGFDLGVIAQGGQASIDMIIGGFELVARLLASDRPVIIACTGHAMAMGSFLLLGADYRVGAAGEFKIAANEVAIGMTVPFAPIELLRHRLTPSAFQRATILAETFTPESAVTAGFLDEIVDADEVIARAQQVAAAAMALDLGAHAATKQRVRARMLEAVRDGIENDREALTSQL